MSLFNDGRVYQPKAMQDITGYVTKAEFEETLGDISAVLDAILGAEENEGEVET